LDEIKAYSDQIAQGPVRVSSALHAKIQASLVPTAIGNNGTFIVTKRDLLGFNI